VERSILAKDAGYVGGYGIVPLSAVVGEFAPWVRRLEWLWEVVNFMRPRLEVEGVQSCHEGCTGSALMKFLREESNTGYNDLEEMALGLVRTAEMVWLRQLSTWVLYGKLPSSGSEDFFIQPQMIDQASANMNLPEFTVQRELVPGFVTPSTASSILFIGQSLHQIRVRDQMLSARSFTADPAMKLLPPHLGYLKAIKLPISTSSFTNVIASIRLSMSQNALTQLLPLPKVLAILHVMQDFLLLGRAEFAMALISNADKRIDNGGRGEDILLPVRKAGRLDELKIKDGDLITALNQTWSGLVALRTESDQLDDALEQGRNLLHIIPKPSEGRSRSSATDFPSFLFPSPASLTLSLPPNSPWALFLTKDDISSYSEMNSYLLSIRRAAIHLASLWGHSSLRRSHPCPNGLPGSGAISSQCRSAEKRKRGDERNAKMRRNWAVANKAQYVISELAGYFQGEIVGGHWQHFLSWLKSLDGGEELASKETSRLGMSNLAVGKVSRPGTGTPTEQFKTSQASAASNPLRRSALNAQPTQSDPATLAKAHQSYLGALRSDLLMNVAGFTRALLDTLRLLDHLVALFARLETTQQNLDLEIDQGVVDALANHGGDEHEILQEMERSRAAIEEQLDELVKQLRESVDRNDAEGAWDSRGQRVDGLDMETLLYTPWRPPNVDGLLMKLEFIGAKAHSEATDDDDEDEMYYSQ
jgi:Gamma tubulin complex component N-terminal/Gamma tubulin complex component C-terminal